MNIQILKKTYTSRFLMGCALLFSYSCAFATKWTDGNITDPTNAAAPGLWAGITGVYALIYGCLWIVALIVIGMGFMKFKTGDVSAALYHLGGGAGMGLTPIVVQWFRGF